VYCCVIQCSQRRQATCGAERSEGEGERGEEKENIAHCCYAIAFRGFCASTVPAWGKYATILKSHRMFVTDNFQTVFNA
jgi:hypothetical protein